MGTETGGTGGMMTRWILSALKFSSHDFSNTCNPVVTKEAPSTSNCNVGLLGIEEEQHEALMLHSLSDAWRAGRKTVAAHAPRLPPLVCPSVHTLDNLFMSGNPLLSGRKDCLN